MLERESNRASRAPLCPRFSQRRNAWTIPESRRWRRFGHRAVAAAGASGIGADGIVEAALDLTDPTVKVSGRYRLTIDEQFGRRKHYEFSSVLNRYEHFLVTCGSWVGGGQSILPGYTVTRISPDIPPSPHFSSRE